MTVRMAAARRMCARRSRRGIAPHVALLPLILALTGCEAGSQFPQTTFRPISEFGRIINSAFYNTFGWTMAILALVVVLVLFASFRYRERPDAPAPKHVHGNTLLEITWTLIPAIIVVFIAVPTVKAIFDTQREPPEDALRIEVIGHQWWWEFRYPEYDITTANEVFIPTGRPISLAMRSADVVHSFWIPRIGGKRDVNPLPRRREGEAPKHDNYLLFTVDEPGRYLGQCAEYCGEAHAIMRMTVVAEEPGEFDSWVRRMRGAAEQEAATPVAQQPMLAQMPAPTGIGNPYREPVPESVLQEEGKRIFLSSTCVACHAIAGTTAAGAVGPNLTMVGARPWVGAGAATMNHENLVAWIRDPQAMKPGTLMPGTMRGGGGMPATGLTDQEVQAVAAYLLSLR